MFAVITSPKFYNEIEQVINSVGEEILFKAIDTSINIKAEVEKINRLSVKHFIIDITCLEDESELAQAIRNYRIRNDKTQIIIIAPDFTPGNITLSSLVTMGVYDILVPKGELEDITIIPLLLEVLDKPTTYAKAVKWDIEDSIIKDKNAPKERNNNKKEIVKDRIIGSINIAIGSSQRGIGATHMSIALANFLARKKQKVAIVELNEKKDLQYLYDCNCKALDNGAFRYSSVDYYPYKSFILSEVFNKDYNYIVMDIGKLVTKYSKDIAIETTKYYSEMLRADIPVLLNGTKEWQLRELRAILKNNNYSYNWKLLFNFTNEKEFKEISNQLNDYDCYFSPFATEPFEIYEEQEKMFADILNEVIPTKIKENYHKNKKSFLKDFLNKFKNVKQ